MPLAPSELLPAATISFIRAGMTKMLPLVLAYAAQYTRLAVTDSMCTETVMLDEVNELGCLDGPVSQGPPSLPSVQPSRQPISSPSIMPSTLPTMEPSCFKSAVEHTYFKAIYATFKAAKRSSKRATESSTKYNSFASADIAAK